MGCSMRRSFLLVIVLVAPLTAQPTYKLGVQENLVPAAEITLKGKMLSRSAVNNDPGFNLQYHFYKDGKPLESINARAKAAVEVPMKDSGLFAVVLEVFYPAYKGGPGPRGQFRAVSNILAYKVAGDKIEAVNSVPALVINCGKGMGKDQDTKALKGYAYKLVQGTAFDGWPASSGKTHAWTDPKLVRFEIAVPAEKLGTLRLHFVDGDNSKRLQKVTV